MNSSTIALEQVDLKANQVRQRMINASQEMITSLWNQLDLSAIYHDWALEGQVVSPEELDAAFDTRAVTDATNLPLNTAIRSHKKAIDYARTIAVKPDLSFSPSLFRDFHGLYASDPENAKNGRYRKEIPLHRSYFHEICHPDKISSSMRKLLDWLNDPEDVVSMHPLEWVTEFHYRFMHIFPFVETSGKVGRTMMNAVLIRHGYLPAIIHATERQRYYEAIRQSQDDLLTLIIESEISSLDAADKYLRSTAIAS
jgi:Fic family protein